MDHVDIVTLRRILVMFVGLVVVAAGMTLVFLSMRAVMDVGGACGSGGPYVIAQPRPEGVVALMPLGIIGGLIGLGLYAMAASKLPGPRLAILAWSALFLSLGWNFWEYGLNPPDGSGTVVWGWIICGVLFVAMGALPLLGLANRDFAKAVLWADTPGSPVTAPQPIPRIPAPPRPRPADDVPSLAHSSVWPHSTEVAPCRTRSSGLPSSESWRDSDEFISALEGGPVRRPTHRHPGRHMAGDLDVPASRILTGRGRVGRHCARQNGGGPSSSMVPVLAASRRIRSKSKGIGAEPGSAGSLAWR